MFLILDFGNTNKKLALYSGGRLRKLVQFRRIGLREVKAFVRAHPGIRAAILSSVIHHSSSINDFLGKSFFFLELTHQTSVPVRNQYNTPLTLGKDRLAAAVAGASLYPESNVLVINCGTCITYDIVDSTGTYLGGAISPGVAMRLKALHTFTGKLPLIEMTARRYTTGRHTRGSILSGCMTGAVAETDGMIDLFREEYPELKVILSGGNINYFAGRLKNSIFAQPNIVLNGLYQILRFNVSQ